MSSRVTKLMQSLAGPAAKPLQQVLWQPAADVYRTSEGWLVKFDLAGVRPQDIELRVQGRFLTILGVRRDWAVQETQHSYSMEISYNRFERTIELPCELDMAQLSTDYRDGMLLVRLNCGGQPR